MAVALVFTILCFAIAVYGTIERVNFIKHSTFTKGVVIRELSKTSSKTDRQFIFISNTYVVSVIKYADAKRNTHLLEETPFLSEAPFVIGETVDVRYDQRDPDIAVVDSFANLFGFLVLLYGCGSLFLLVFWYLWKNARMVSA